MTAEKPEWSTEVTVTKEMEKLCIEMKPEIEKEANTTFDFFAPITYRGLNLLGSDTLVKVYFGVDKCVHAYLSTDGRIKSVPAVKYPIPASAPLVPFLIPLKPPVNL